MTASLPPGWNLSAIFRAGTGKRYHSRPPSNCEAARKFWDTMADDGPVEWIQLLDGYWGAQRPGSDDPPEEHEAIHYRRPFRL